MKKKILSSLVLTLVFSISLLAMNSTEVIAGAVQITGLSDTTLARSGRLRIFGTGFGADGQVLINNQPAPVADWTDTLIVAYVKCLLRGY